MTDLAARQSAAGQAPKRLHLFERYLSAWVGLCMVAGVVLGKTIPALADSLRRLEFRRGAGYGRRRAHRSARDAVGVVGVCNRTRHWFPAPQEAG